jgi:hypothetical protein
MLWLAREQIVHAVTGVSETAWRKITKTIVIHTTYKYLKTLQKRKNDAK